MIKPDGVQRGLTGEIIGRFEKRGYKLVAMKMVHASQEQCVPCRGWVEASGVDDGGGVGMRC